jgi:N-acetylglucosamine kinase-like BadF-type ATPase
MVHVLGIDGGGTKTVALVADLRGNVLGRGTSGASNYQTVGLDRAVAALKEASEKAAAAAGIAAHRFEVACLGLAGVGRETDRALLLPAITELGLADRIILEHDAAIALAGATACQPGVVVLAGTGAMAFGMNEEGKKRRSGGWGNILGDEGSAYYIGRRALAAACRAYDGRGPKTALVSRLMEHLKLDHFTDIVKKTYDRVPPLLQRGVRGDYKEASPQKIASLALLVSELATAGDEVATTILRDAAGELALAANAVIKGLGMQDEQFQVAVSGSVFKAGEPLLIPFAESVKSTAPRAEITSPRFEPAMGAVFLALQEVGVELSNVVSDE